MTTIPKKTPVVGYIRVSTQAQVDDGQGLEIQEAQIQDYCRKNKLVLVKLYADEGISGAEINRPSLQEMITDSRQGEFQFVVTPKLDRIGRDTFTTLWIEKELKKNGVEIFSIAEPFHGNDPLMKGFREMMMVFASIEKSIISNRLQNGRRHKAAKGGFAGHALALGYCSEDQEMKVNTAEAETVRYIFRLRRHFKLTPYSIAKRLNTEQRPTKRGGRWHPWTIQTILDKKTLYFNGEMQFSGINKQRADLKLQ